MKANSQNRHLPWNYSPQKTHITTDPERWPIISIVTPSYNQEEFLESAIQSVLLQGYSGLEYIVIDGGSSDDSVESIRRYESSLTYWVSEPDNGVYHALNKGFRRTTGEIMGWLNSSDMLCPWALQVVAQIFVQNPEVEWITTLYPLRWESNGLPIRCREVPGYNRELFYEGRCHLQQESTFWRRSLWEKAGSRIDERYQYAAEFALWATFYEHANLYGVNVPLGGSRYHEDNTSSSEKYKSEFQMLFQNLRNERGYHQNTLRKFARNLPYRSSSKFNRLLDKLVGYDLYSIEGKSSQAVKEDEDRKATDWRTRVRKKLV